MLTFHYFYTPNNYKLVAYMKLFVQIMPIFLLATILFSCAKEEERTSKVPYAGVNIDISTIIDHEFNNPYHHKKYYSNKNGVQYAGYAGVLVISNDDASWLYAYDLCCPHEAPLRNELQVNQWETKAKCPKCGSVYLLMNDGRVEPESGPATEKLKGYRVLRDGSFYRVRN